MIWITIGHVPGVRGEEIPERRFCLAQGAYVAKLFLFIGFRLQDSLPTSGPGAGTSQPTAGSAARGGFGQKNQSPGLFPTREHVSRATCVPPLPSAAATDRCVAALPLTDGTPEQNGQWKALPVRPAHRGGSFPRDAPQYSRRRGVSRLAITRHGWVPAPRPSANHLKY